MRDLEEIKKNTNYINLDVDADGLFTIPVLFTKCTCKEDAYYEEYKERRVLGYAFDVHLIYLKCNGVCEKTIKQAWHPIRDSNGKFTKKFKFHSVLIQEDQS